LLQVRVSFDAIVTADTAAEFELMKTRAGLRTGLELVHHPTPIANPRAEAESSESCLQAINPDSYRIVVEESNTYLLLVTEDSFEIVGIPEAEESL
jgi:hypothetical protein